MAEPTAPERLIADRIRDRRTEADISQRTVATRMQEQGHDWHQTTVARTEQGQRPLRVAELVALATALRTNLADVLGLTCSAESFAEQQAIGRRALAEDLRDSLDAGEISGTPIEWHGQKVWIHTTEQVDRWVSDRLKEADDA